MSILNPHVALTFTAESLLDLNLADYDVVVASDMSFKEYIDLNERVRALNVPFFVIDSFGYFGYSFEDLGETFHFEKRAATVRIAYA